MWGCTYLNVSILVELQIEGKERATRHIVCGDTQGGINGEKW